VVFHHLSVFSILYVIPFEENGMVKADLALGSAEAKQRHESK